MEVAHNLQTVISGPLNAAVLGKLFGAGPHTL